MSARPLIVVAGIGNGTGALRFLYLNLQLLINVSLQAPVQLQRTS